MTGSFFKTEALRTLEFWQQVELFTPFDLDQLPGDTAFPLTEEELRQGNAPQLLPWLRDLSEDPYELENCELYLGVFDLEDTRQICEKRRLIEHDRFQAMEESQRSVQRTCFARLRVNAQGVPDLKTLSCSTLPWALGRLDRNALEEISLDNFLHSRQDLLQKLGSVSAESPLQPAALVEFVHTLFDWAGFHPRPQPLLVLNESWRKRCAEPQRSVMDRSIILNSAYLHDLQEATALVSADHAPVPLQQYLQGGHLSARVDLLQPESQNTLCNHLRPNLMNAGHWPTEAGRATNLMQQFAINTAFEQLTNTGLYSLHTPPGTGKTTVLREIVAENLVRRAAVLARFESPEDAFQGMAEIGLEGEGGTWAVPLLNPALTGYEMVIASANRHALEHVSRQLSADGFLEMAGTLTAQNKQDWANRYDGPDFQIAKSAFKEAEAQITEQITELDEYATYQLEPQSEKQYCRAELERVRVTRAVLESITAARRASEAQLAHLKYDLGKLEREAELLRWKEPQWWKRAAFWTEESVTHKKLMQRNTEDQGSLKLRITAEERDLQANPAYQTDKAQHDVTQAEQHLQTREADFRRKQERLAALQRKWKVRSCSGENINLETPEAQKHALWQNAELNQSRFRLFEAALQLHQAWLAHVLKQDEFNRSLTTVEKVLSGCRPANSEQTASTWQWLFMIAPVIPCPLSSFHQQYHSLPPQTLGWLFVLEGAQTMPQAVIGAINKARRVLAMGDPQQLSPAPVVAAGQQPISTSAQTLFDRANPFGSLWKTEAGDLWTGSLLRVQRRCGEPVFSAVNALAYRNKLLRDVAETGSMTWFDVPEGEQVQFLLNRIILMYTESGDRLPSVYVFSPFRRLSQKLRCVLRNPNEWNSRVKAGHTPGKTVLDRWVAERVGALHDFQGKSEQTVFFVLGGDVDSAEWLTQTPNVLNTALLCARSEFRVIGDRALWKERRYFNELNFREN